MQISNGMGAQNMPASQASYDARWFVWTIVFLVVTGISLVSYIVLSDTTETDVPAFFNVKAASQQRK